MNRRMVLGIGLAMMASACAGAGGAGGRPGDGTPRAHASTDPSVGPPVQTGTTPGTGASSPSPSGSPDVPRFRGSSEPIDAATRQGMSASWREGCPVPIDELRLLTMDHWGFDAVEHSGRMVVHRSVVEDVLHVVEDVFLAGFPIERMELVDEYDGDDDRSMAANNTSGFNCREVAGSPGVWSQHAFGLAIDVNPVQNPYVTDDVVQPPAGQAYLDRTQPVPGLITAGGAVVRAFAAAGWTWGGEWSTPDYQHFSASGD